MEQKDEERLELESSVGAVVQRRRRHLLGEPTSVVAELPLPFEPCSVRAKAFLGLQTQVQNV